VKNIYSELYLWFTLFILKNITVYILEDENFIKSYGLFEKESKKYLIDYINKQDNLDVLKSWTKIAVIAESFDEFEEKIK
jgi:hypothetical protein